MPNTLTIGTRGQVGILQELTVAALALSDPSRSTDDFLQSVAARFGCQVALFVEAVGDTTLELSVRASAGLTRDARALPLSPVASHTAIASVVLPYPETAAPGLTRWVVEVHPANTPSPSSFLVLVFAQEPPHARQYRGMLQHVAQHLDSALRHRALYEQLVDRERHLRVVSSRLHALVEHLPCGVLAADEARLVTHANQAFCDMFGIEVPPSALVGQSAPAILQSLSDRLVDYPSLAARAKELLASNEVHPLEEMRFVDGTILEFAYVPIQLDGAGHGALWTLWDVTRTRRAAEEIRVLNEDLEQRVAARTHELAVTQDQLLQASKLAAVGQLAAGVGHEINNPLTYMLGNAELLAEELARLPDAPPARVKDLVEMVDEIRQGAERIKHVVSGLRTFGRVAPERCVPVEIAEVLESAIKLSFTQIRHSARLVRDYHPTPLVQADEIRLGQVFINLLVNAAQALPSGNAQDNEIRITTSTDSLGRAVIEICDTGHGMSAEVRARIFEPFFTTKPVGTGTGLGLSICHGIVAGLGGELSVESNPGSGATFRVALPPARTEAQVVSAPPPAATWAGDRRSVLVVDDEPQVGLTLSRILSHHDVTVVTSARAALDAILAGNTPDVLFCDLMMPEMSGMDLHERLQELRPHLSERMVFMTGGVFTTAAREFVEQRPDRCFDKPFRVEQIRAMVEGHAHSVESR